MAGRLNSLVCTCAGALALLLGTGAQAATAPKLAQKVLLRPAMDVPSRPSKIAPAPEPAMWKIVNGKSTVYLLGSIHLLPAGFTWRTPEIDRAVEAADVFLFETNIDFATAEHHYFVDHQGYLPAGQTLHEKLSPEALKQYWALIKGLRLDQNKIDYLRPGVALWYLGQIPAKDQTRLGPGVDAALTKYAKEHGKQLGYLETLQSQFEVLAELGGGAETAMLEKSLTDMGKGDDKFSTMLAAWAEGDLPKLRSVGEQDPKQTVILLDNRNKAWLPKIEALLGSPKTYLITVGAAHLAGKNSVIDLLCAKHWKIERVQTGSSPPPPACPT